MSQRRVFTDEFKPDAVRLAKERGSTAEVDRDLNVQESVLSRWKKRLEAAPARPFPGHGNPQDLELARMSRKGNCYDNAPIESFFASLKRKLVYRTTFVTREEARGAIFEWMACWYNRKRRHSTLGYVSPEVFEQAHEPQPEPMRQAA